MVLSAQEIEQFVTAGFVKLDGVFSRETASACRDILWRDLKLSPDRPSEWTQPVMRLGMYVDPPFRDAATSPRLHAALDQLVGVGRWVPPQALGAMVVRFPTVETPWDDGWHIDASFPPPDDPQTFDYFKWRVNFESRGRAMLMLFLFSDCGPDDAPTRVRVGSHLPTARRLKVYGEAGASIMQLAEEGYYAESAACDVALATGEAGTVWLLHPFAVHAAQAHRGKEVRFLAQPGLLPAETPRDRGNEELSPVFRAIKRALEEQ